MIVCDSFFGKNGQPKYLDEAVALMEKANEMGFATQADWQQRHVRTEFLCVIRED